LKELRDHFADLRAEGERDGLGRADAAAAALDRLGGVEQLAKAMTEQRQFQSWCVRVPWAAFGVAPMIVLGAAWLIALLILWTGWNMFLPGSSIPFVRVDGLPALYFGVGRSIFLSAPLFLGWAIGVVAARQRLRVEWPLVGLLLLALIGGTAQVHTSAQAVAGAARHVSLGFTLAPIVQGNPYGLLHMLMLLAAMMLPYLIWRVRTAYFARSLFELGEE
jgi:hypothetical protein